MDKHLEKQIRINPKCRVFKCKEITNIYQTTIFGLLPLCDKHFIESLKDEQRAENIARIMLKFSGETVKINSFTEFKKKVNEDFLFISTSFLKYTDGKCVVCGSSAVLFATGRALCELHADFPRLVYKEALKAFGKRGGLI